MKYDYLIVGAGLFGATFAERAAAAGKRALTLLTISDNIVTHEELSAEERQLGFTKMMEIALKTAVKMAEK